MLGLKRRTVLLIPHNPSWESAFSQARAEIVQVTGLSSDGVHHIGSTAVADLMAKPILDIAVGAAESDDVDAIAAALVGLGYIDRGHGEDGIGRLLVWESAPDVRTIHVHIVPTQSDWLKQRLVLRDALRSTPELRQRYSAVKQELANRFPLDRKSYTAGKEQVIREILRLAESE